MEERRTYRQGRFVYLLDDDDHTAWIAKGHIGRCKTYRVPSHVEIEGVQYTITSIELGAYRCPHTLQHLIFPDTIEYIDEDEFCNVPNLRSVHMGKGVQYLLNWNFRCCPKLNTITIDPLNEHLKVEDGLVLTKDGTILLRSLFRRKELRIPEGVKYVEKVAFWYDDKLEMITFPSSLREISDNSFSHLPKLKRVVVPDGMERMLAQCFMRCKHLEYVDLPATLQELGMEIFEECFQLKTLILRSPIVLEYDHLIWAYTHPFHTCQIYVPKELLMEYRKDKFWGKFKHILPISDDGKNEL